MLSRTQNYIVNSHAGHAVGAGYRCSISIIPVHAPPVPGTTEDPHTRLSGPVCRAPFWTCMTQVNVSKKHNTHNIAALKIIKRIISDVTSDVLTCLVTEKHCIISFIMKTKLHFSNSWIYLPCILNEIALFFKNEIDKNLQSVHHIQEPNALRK